MEDEEDDFYDPADSVPTGEVGAGVQNGAANPLQETDIMDEEEEEVEDDDDDFNIITEAPAGGPPVESLHLRPGIRQETHRPGSADSAAISKSATPSATPRLDIATPVPGTAAAAVARPTAPSKPGSSYPPIHTSTIDINANPIHPMTGKPIMASDMDDDFPADDKPWRRPGSDISDYFNYGFDEFTWASYILKQQEVRKEVGDQKRQLDDMQSFLGMGMPPMPGPPGGPGAAGSAPPAMPGMPGPGMPDMNPEMMQGMLASMMSQGLDPSSMDPMAFMQHAQAMMGGQPGGGPQGQSGFGGQGQGQGFGGGQGQMGYGGYDQRGGYGGRGRGRRW